MLATPLPPDYVPVRFLGTWALINIVDLFVANGLSLPRRPIIVLWFMTFSPVSVCREVLHTNHEWRSPRTGLSTRRKCVDRINHSSSTDVIFLYCQSSYPYNFRGLTVIEFCIFHHLFSHYYRFICTIRFSRNPQVLVLLVKACW